MSSPSSPSRRLWYAFGALLLLCGIGLTIVRTAGDHEATARGPHKGWMSSEDADSDDPAGQTPRRTRSADRLPSVPPATHSAQQLRDFYLDPLDFEGDTLRDALAKVRAAYEDVCARSGEKPLQITFTLPPGTNPVLHLKAESRTLESTVHLLAAVSKLTVNRHGREFRFTLPQDTNGKILTATYDGPPGLLPADLGIALKPETRITRKPGSFTISTPHADDFAALASLVKSHMLNPVLQHMLTMRVATYPSNVPWSYPDRFELDESGFQAFARKLKSAKGCDFMSLPSVMANPGEDATIEITRDLVARSDLPDGGFVTHPVGNVLVANIQPLGLGHQLQSHFSATSGEVDPSTGRAKIDTHADMDCDGFSPDAQYIVTAQTHPDGSRSIVVLTPTRMDATGRPMREKPEE